MPKSNIHLLTEDDKRYLNEKYQITLQDDKIAVKTVNYNRITLHERDKPFSLNTVIRKLTINTDAINFWYEHIVNKLDNITLIDVQAAINILIVSYQDLSYDNIMDILQPKPKKKRR